MSKDVDSKKINVLHINGNYVVTALHQTMIEYLDQYTKNQVFAHIYPITEEQLSVVPNDNVIISQCYNKNDRYFFRNKQRKIYKSLLQNVDVSSFDLVHAYTLFSDGNCALELKKKYGLPYVVAIRATDVNVFFRKAVFLRKRGVEILREAERVFFLSQSYKEQVFNNYIPSKYIKEIDDKCHVIPNGIDNIWFDNIYINKNIDETELRLNNKELRIISVGVITKRKNVLKTAEAVSLLIENGWKVDFTVIGQPIDTTIVESFSNYPFLHYYSKMPMKDLINYYRENDIYVMPSISETFGLTYAEALTQQLPVVYTKKQGFDQQFEDGYVGYSVDSADAESIVEQIQKICVNYRTICSHTVDASNKFKWENIANQYFQIYEDIVQD